MSYAPLICLLPLSTVAQMYVSFEDLSPQQEGRFQDRFAAVEAWFTGGQAIGEAVKIFDVLRQQRNLPAVKDPHHFIHYQVDKLERYYTLLNVHEHPRGKKVPDQEIKCAADILAAGYEQRLYAMVDGALYEYDEARHFTSIKQASMVSAPFQAIMKQYDVTPRHMLKRIHEVAPELAFSALPMKIQLTPENMLYRMGYADWMYRQHTTRDHLFLHKILWGDETRIYIGRDIQGKLKVYHYPGRYDGQPPISNPLLNRENTIRLDVSLFVDGFRGLSHVEVLTGTTNLESEGRFWAPMQVLQVDRARHGQPCYTVS
jgi:hypothetical protein